MKSTIRSFFSKQRNEFVVIGPLNLILVYILWVIWVNYLGYRWKNGHLVYEKSSFLISCRGRVWLVEEIVQFRRESVWLADISCVHNKMLLILHVDTCCQGACRRYRWTLMRKNNLSRTPDVSTLLQLSLMVQWNQPRGIRNI